MKDTCFNAGPASLKADQGLLLNLLEHIPDRVYFKDGEGRFLRVSRAEAVYLGATAVADVIGKSDFDFFAPDLAQAASDDEQRIMRTGKPMEGKVERKTLLDGRTGWALVAKIPLRNAAGQIIGTCGISKDITALKEAEAALEEANASLATQKSQVAQALFELNKTHEELKAAQQQLIELENINWIARLAYGVAHEIRNPLGTLEMGVSALLAKPAIAQTEVGIDMLKAMSGAIHRADVVTTALMDGARSSGVAINAAEIAATLDRAVNLMKRTGPVTEA